MKAMKNGDGLYFCERSLYSDKFVFAKTYMKDGTFTQEEAALYERMFGVLSSSIDYKLDGVTEFQILSLIPRECVSFMYKTTRSSTCVRALRHATLA